jgi:hypothetical protein
VESNMDNGAREILQPKGSVAISLFRFFMVNTSQHHKQRNCDLKTCSIFQHSQDINFPLFFAKDKNKNDYGNKRKGKSGFSLSLLHNNDGEKEKRSSQNLLSFNIIEINSA